MAIPFVDLINQDGLTFRFTYYGSKLFFSAVLQSAPFLPPLLTIFSETCSVHASSSSSFEVYFSSAIFVFPHSEFQKFKTFLESVKALKVAA